MTKTVQGNPHPQDVARSRIDNPANQPVANWVAAISDPHAIGRRAMTRSAQKFEVNGISIGTIMKFFSMVRNKQWLISGDILTAGDQTVLRLRLNGEGVARYWEIRKSGGMDAVALIRTATEKMLADQNPEMLGRSFLQQGLYHRAIDVFHCSSSLAPVS